MNLQFLNSLEHISKEQSELAYNAGMLLVLSTSIYLILFGNTLSVSNMLGDILKSTFTQPSRKNLTFISGLVFFSALVKIMYHEHLTAFQPYDLISYSEIASPIRLILSGLMVGFGSQYAKMNTGNTLSFDGVGRFSFKSIIGNIFVLITACLIHTYNVHVYLPATPRILDIDLPENITYSAYLLVCILIPFFSFVISGRKSFKSLISYLSLFSIGILYAFGLMYGQFTKRTTVYQYLVLDETWNPSMFLIYGYGVLGALIVYVLMRFLLRKPMFNTKVVEDRSGWSGNLIVGAIIYGVGWGLGGLRPGEVFILMPLQSIKIIFYWGLSCLIGMKIVQRFFQDQNLWSNSQIKTQ